MHLGGMRERERERQREREIGLLLYSSESSIAFHLLISVVTTNTVKELRKRNDLTREI